MKESLKKLIKRNYDFRKMQAEVSTSHPHLYKLVGKRGNFFVQWIDPHCAEALVPDLEELELKGEKIFDIEFPRNTSAIDTTAASKYGVLTEPKVDSFKNTGNHEETLFEKFFEEQPRI